MFFPLQPKAICVDTERDPVSKSIPKLQTKISGKFAKKMFKALLLQNKGKTPLHLAIDNDQIWLEPDITFVGNYY